MGRDVLAFIGVGDYVIERVDAQSNMVIRAASSPFADEYLRTRGRSAKPVCHYMRGVLAGVAETVFGAEYDVEEASCKATGMSKECIFKLTRKKKASGKASAP